QKPRPDMEEVLVISKSTNLPEQQQYDSILQTRQNLPAQINPPLLVSNQSTESSCITDTVISIADESTATQPPPAYTTTSAETATSTVLAPPPYAVKVSPPVQPSSSPLLSNHPPMDLESASASSKQKGQRTRDESIESKSCLIYLADGVQAIFGCCLICVTCFQCMGN
ncbi:hypothetical protein BDF19DRAFT_440514, partial [Syncephalis fuscata]